MNLRLTAHTAFAALIVAFIFHNLEEAISICKYPVQSPVAFIRLATCRQFLVSVTFITSAVLVAFGIAIRTRKSRLYLFISTAIASGLVLNVFIPHILAAIYTLNYSPGLISAVALNLPLGLITLSKNKSKYESRKQFYQHIGAGLIIGYLLFAAAMGLVMHFIY